MANANDSGDEEEERETNTGNQDNSYRLKIDHWNQAKKL